MKEILPMLLMIAAPSIGSAQSNAGIKMENMDKTAKPADDFYKYACGGWQKLHPLPGAFSRFGSFDQLQEDNNQRINDIIASLTKKTFKAGTVERKLSDLYKLAMDSVRRDKEGASPVQPLMKEIEQAQTIDALRALQLKYADMGYGLPYGYYFGSDEKNASMNILSLVQSGLTLGEKEYYLENDEATTEIRNAFKKHIAKMFQLYGFSEAQAQENANLIMRYETTLALVSKNNTELRDVEANYNKMTIKEFESNYPHIGLTKQLKAEGIADNCFVELVVGQPDFFAGVDKLIATQSAAELKAYIEWNVICSSASYLSNEIVSANFDFYGKTMSGRTEMLPLWKRATSQVDGVLGESLGKMYCEKYFPAKSKARMEQLVKNLQASLAERIKAQDWMSEATKAAALDKLAAFYVKIGYPNKWKDVSALTIDPKKSYYDNILECRKFWNKFSIESKAGKPVDRDEWMMSPQTVNAYYNPTTNEICFPAGILQYPFFDAKADDAFNYGAIGVVIGHEMTHGFDDQGRHYDKSGNMTDWWADGDADKFNERAKVCADFFSNIEVLPGLKGNGEFTLGENLADHGGLMVSFNAFKHATAKKPLKTIHGLTPEQRFFIAYAGVWAANITDKEIRNRTKGDPHALGKWRVNAALPHIDAWYEAFGVKEGDKLFVPAKDRVKLW